MYLVTLNKDHTYNNESHTREEITHNLISKGANEVTFRPSRRNDEFEFVVVNNKTVAKAFYTQTAQISYLRSVGKI